MKKFLITLAIPVLMFLFLSSDSQAQSVFDKWPALGSFHEVMSQTFHPMEDGNLEPIKTRSAEMSEKANLLSASEIPAEFNTPQITDAVKRLEDGCKLMNESIAAGAGDEEIKASLIKMHDVFHEIAGLCVDEHKKEDPSK
jgi:hypothetical protein